MNTVGHRLRGRVRTGRWRLEPDQGFEYSIDVCNVDGVTGWVLHRSGVNGIHASARGAPVGEARWGIARTDVAAAKPGVPNALNSGFTVAFGDGTFPSTEPVDVQIEFAAIDGSVLRLQREIWPVRERSGELIVRGKALSPLPSDVVACLERLRPYDYLGATNWDSALTARAVSDIVRVLTDKVVVKPVLRYAHFLRSMRACFDFVSTHFDRINRLTDPGAKDFEAAASSPDEILCIANHLYVLRSRGVEGNLIECGCFKGFSTCCLSHACAWLGIRMDVFDSFAGLPPSDSEYYKKGDFTGTLEEVRDNLSTFGRSEVASLHQGFFSETLPRYRGPVMCIWMDVDLEDSARDVMNVLRVLQAEGCVFSHECPASAFEDDVPRPTESEVLPPILQAFASRGAPVAGRHLTGYLGALWVPGQAVPPLGKSELARIVAAGA